MLSVKHQVQALDVSSAAFGQGSYIPAKYTCDGANVSPPLSIGNMPARTKTLAIIVDDPDAPHGTWLHWLVWNIAPAGNIAENSRPGTEGMTDFGDPGYGGPCPPSGVHHYHFKVYALDTFLNLNPKATKQDVEKAMAPHILAFGELVGQYKRAK